MSTKNNAFTSTHTRISLPASETDLKKLEQSGLSPDDYEDGVTTAILLCDLTGLWIFECGNRYWVMVSGGADCVGTLNRCIKFLQTKHN